jgi:hypothetical protein
MSVSAFNMHAGWRQIQEYRLRELIKRAREIGNAVTITPYARDRGFRSFIVSWSSEGCEGHLYVVRIRALAKARVSARPVCTCDPDYEGHARHCPYAPVVG